MAGSVCVVIEQYKMANRSVSLLLLLWCSTESIYTKSKCTRRCCAAEGWFVWGRAASDCCTFASLSLVLLAVCAMLENCITMEHDDELFDNKSKLLHDDLLMAEKGGGG